ncbi:MULTISPECIES: phage tail protein I [Serratia]|uniref:phage tail protein I n=1 Tax=Serratia TaxID=613 RepID=UPI0011F159C3|nr:MULTISPECIES: phage tail protein I [Serratia]NRN13176.1 phage tail protein I [Serratia marcescens]NRN35782.1 phage tail protein I [Serratia marcescens]
MSNTLLPPSASTWMRHTETATARLSAITVALRTLWTPTDCPVDLLPYLAWALSVDRWDKNWPEATKRKVIADAYFVHCHKGTIGALRRVVEPLGYLIEVREWWDSGDPPGTFRLVIGVLEQGITEEMYLELERVINDAKPVSRHLIGMTLIQNVPGTIFIGAAAVDGDVITVYPG